MSQGLKSTAYTFSQFFITIFEPLSKVHNILQMPTFLSIYQENLFGIYIDNYFRTAKTFDTIYAFLRDSYFSRIVFSLMYLLKKKIKAFMNIVKLLKFEKSCRRLKLLAKYWNKIKLMPVPNLQKELDAFL